MTRKTWLKFWRLLILITIISIASTILIWYLIGNKLNLKGGYLDIDFFNLLCATFGIVGLVMAIFQIAAIRGEQEITNATAQTVHIQYFKAGAVKPIGDAISELTSLQQLINSTYSYNRVSLTSFLDRVQRVIYIFDTLHNQQVALECGTIIDCEKCLSLLNELQGDFSKIMDENLYPSFQRQAYNIKMTEIVSQVTKCDIAVKK